MPTTARPCAAPIPRSLGGVSFDQSFRLSRCKSPVLTKPFRSIIPESIAAANANADFETWGLSVEQKLGKGTFVGLSEKY